MHRTCSPAAVQSLLHGGGGRQAASGWVAVQVIKDMVALVLCSTDAEANNLGIFLQHTMTLMSHWRVCPPPSDAPSTGSTPLEPLSHCRL